MDGDRFRASDRRVVNGSSGGRDSSPSYRQDDEPVQPAPQPRQYTAEEPPIRARSSRQEPAPAPKKRLGWLWMLIIIAVAALAFGGWALWSQSEKGKTGIDTGKYQAVFLSNGQLYFGKMKVLSDVTFQLDDVYYLEQVESAASVSSAEEAAKQSTATLRKLGEIEPHAPEDTMFIPKQQVLFYENLQDSGKVVKLIGEHKQQAR